jgi:hypothetical protein
MERYGIANDLVLGIVIEKIRERMKESIAAQSSIEIINENGENITTDKVVDENDVYDLSDQTIMSMIMEADNSATLASDEGAVILGADNGSDYAANMARNYIFKHGAAGFLPAGGHLRVMYRLYYQINTMMQLIGGTELGTDIHWSSTQYNANIAWLALLDYNDFGYHDKIYSHDVRALCSFPN